MDLLLLTLALPIGILVGLGASLVGLTAWPLVVPLLLIVGDYSPQEAILTSMTIDLVNASTVSAFYRRRSSVGLDAPKSLRMGVAAVIPAVAAAFLAFPILGLYSDAFKGGSGVINLFLGSLFVVQAIRTEKNGVTKEEHPLPASSERWTIVFIFCMVQGLVTGLIGIGGAMNIVIALLIATSIPTQRAVGTAMGATLVLLTGMVIAYLALFAFALPTWDIILVFSSIAFISCILGLLRSEHFSERYLRLAIGIVVLIAAIFAILQVALLQ